MNSLGASRVYLGANLLSGVRRNTLSPNAELSYLRHALGARRGAHKKHRQVTVELLEEVTGLGSSGTRHEVSPGYMRNYLRPKALATYVPKGAHAKPAFLLRPTPIETPSGPKVVTLNIDELAERIAGLPQLKFERRLQSSSSSSSASSSSEQELIYGSVTTHDITKLIETEHGLSLVAPDAILSFQNGQDRIRQTGLETVEVNFRNGSTVFLSVEVVNAAA